MALRPVGEGGDEQRPFSAVRDGRVFVGVTDPTTPALTRGIRTQKVDVQPEGSALQHLLDELAAGRFTVRVADTLPLERAAEGHRRALEGGLRGKIVLTL